MNGFMFNIHWSLYGHQSLYPDYKLARTQTKAYVAIQSKKRKMVGRTGFEPVTT